MRIFELFFPKRCCGCGEILDFEHRDGAFCEKCSALWQYAKSICRTEYGGVPVTVYDPEMHEEGIGGAALFLVYYDKNTPSAVQNKLIYSLKDRSMYKNSRFAAKELASLIRTEADFVCRGGIAHENTVIAWIPRRKRAIGLYGFDHMERMAIYLAEILEVEAVPVIVRLKRASEQKRLNAKERFKNASASIALSEDFDVFGKNVILIDDVITSGASVNAAAKLLASAGARNIISVAIAKSDRPLD